MKLPTRLLVFGCMFLATAIAEPGRWQWGRQVDPLAGAGAGSDPLASAGSDPLASAGSDPSASSGSSGSSSDPLASAGSDASAGSSGSSSASSGSDPLASSGSGAGSSGSSDSSASGSSDSSASGSSGSSSASDGSSSGSSGSSDASSGSAPVTEAPTTTTTTTAAPVGSSRTYTFGGGAAGGLSITMTLTQAENNELHMYCNVATDPSATETLIRFCDAPTDKKPKFYLVQGFTDCSAITTEDTVQAQEIATVEKPNEVVTDAKVLSIKFSDLENNCI